VHVCEVKNSAGKQDIGASYGGIVRS